MTLLEFHVADSINILKFVQTFCLYLKTLKDFLHSPESTSNAQNSRSGQNPNQMTHSKKNNLYVQK